MHHVISTGAIYDELGIRHDARFPREVGGEVTGRVVTALFVESSLMRKHGTHDALPALARSVGSGRRCN